MANFEVRAWQIFCYCLIFITGVIGNSIVILVVMKSSGTPKQRLRDVPFNVYLMALAIVDMALCIVCLPVYIMSTTAFPHPTGTGGDVFCKLVTGNVPQFWLAGVSIYLLVVISYERYAAITKPFKMRLGITKKTYIYIGLAWFFGFARELPVIVGIRYSATKATVGTSCYYWPEQLASIFIFSLLFISQYVIPAGIFLYNFYRIKKRINTLDTSLKTALGQPKQRVEIMKSKRRTIRIVLMVLVTFLVCWTPNNIMYLLFQYGHVSDVSWSSDYYQFGIILGFSSSCINPFLYAFQSKQFRVHCGKVLRKIFKIGGLGPEFKRRAATNESITSSTMFSSSIPTASHVKMPLR